MATRSHIGVRNTDGTVDYIYCHWDGYPSNNGHILAEYYQDMDKVNELMKLGDLSFLGEKIGEKHDFGSSVKGWCKSYSRDRGEKNVSVATSTFINFIKNCGQAEYLYLFDGEFWDCYDTRTNETINLYDKLYNE